ncbi:MAG TPA: Hsp20/alpha crystallin family protein [Xanthobacteraceae bacterium]|nr:Hsp20/alpha crystallin family protein [Xanthobacteraceae bacterium]
MDSEQQLQMQEKRDLERKPGQRTRRKPMDPTQELQVQQKREREGKEEPTIPARIFLPMADIYETEDALKVVLEMPGVEKASVQVHVEDGVLNVEGRLDLSKYKGLLPVYTEYNIGHYSRSFRLSNKINQDKIGAEMKEGVLSLTLPKVEEAKPRTIEVV